MKQQLAIAIAVSAIFAGRTVFAQTQWTGGTSSDFNEASNWTDGAPSSFDSHAIVDGGNNLPIQIGANAGTIEIGAISLGSFDSGGHLVQNGGTLIIFGDDIGQESQIGNEADDKYRAENQ